MQISFLLEFGEAAGPSREDAARPKLMWAREAYPERKNSGRITPPTAAIIGRTPTILAAAASTHPSKDSASIASYSNHRFPSTGALALPVEEPHQQVWNFLKSNCAGEDG
jgi:hypothetical protein